MNSDIRLGIEIVKGAPNPWPNLWNSRYARSYTQCTHVEVITPEVAQWYRGRGRCDHGHWHGNEATVFHPTDGGRDGVTQTWHWYIELLVT